MNLNSFIMHTTATISVMKTTNIPLSSTIVFCIILVVVQQSVYGQLNWNDGGRDIKWRMNCDFSGHYIDRISSTGNKCGSLCIASINCTHFRHASDGFCYLKNAPLEIQPTFATKGMCGFVPWKLEPGRDHWNSARFGVKWLNDCDFVGHDIGREQSSAELCGDVCLNNPDCTHFRHDGEFCHVKKAPLSTPRTAVNGGMCGYISSRNFDNNNNKMNTNLTISTVDSQEFCECVC